MDKERKDHLMVTEKRQNKTKLQKKCSTENDKRKRVMMQEGRQLATERKKVHQHPRNNYSKANQQLHLQVAVDYNLGERRACSG